MYKRIISIVIVITMFLSMNINVFAIEKIENDDVNDIYKYMQNHLINELNIVSNNKSYDIQINGKVEITKPIRLIEYNVEDNNIILKDIYYSLIKSNGNFVAIYSMAKLENGEIVSNISKGFSDILNKNNSNKFIFIKVKDTLNLLTNNSMVVLEEDYNSKINTNAYYSKINNLVKKLNISNNENINLVSLKSDPGAPIDYKFLNVDIVPQGNHSWCWAASCAAIINYMKGENLSARDVVDYAETGDIESGGTRKEKIAALKHWGIEPIEDYYMPFWMVKNIIKSNTPILVDFFTCTSGHSMVFRGYEEYSSNEIYYNAIDPNKSSGVLIKATEYGNNVYYIMCGAVYYWNNSYYAK